MLIIKDVTAGRVELRETLRRMELTGHREAGVSWALWHGRGREEYLLNFISKRCAGIECVN